MGLFPLQGIALLKKLYFLFFILGLHLRNYTCHSQLNAYLKICVSTNFLLKGLPFKKIMLSNDAFPFHFMLCAGIE